MSDIVRAREICAEFVQDKIDATAWRSKMVATLSRISDDNAFLMALIILDIGNAGQLRRQVK
jgi:hypothetical protein